MNVGVAVGVGWSELIWAGRVVHYFFVTVTLLRDCIRFGLMWFGLVWFVAFCFVSRSSCFWVLKKGVGGAAWWQKVFFFRIWYNLT